MNEFLNIVESSNLLVCNVTGMQIIITILICFALELVIGFTYVKTSKSRTYSQSFLQTLIIIGMVTSIIILIIGSNLARAFGLAGSLSLIRFRTALKDPKDIAFILFSMGLGLTCGGGYYTEAFISVIMISALIYVLYLTNYGYKGSDQKKLKITIPENLNYNGLFEDVFKEYLDEFELIRVKSLSLGTMFELIFVIREKEINKEKEFIDKIRVKNGNLPVILILKEDDE